MAGAAPLDLARLSERVGQQAEEARGEGRRLLQHRDAYTELHNRLLTFTDSMTHQVMVLGMSRIAEEAHHPEHHCT